MKRNITPLLFGVALLLAGLGYLGSVFFGWNFTLFFPGWWTLFIIVPALVSLFANGPHSFPIAALIVGVLLLLRAQRVLSSHQAWVVIAAGVIITIGVALIVKYIRQGKTPPPVYTTCQNGAYPPPPPPPPQGNYRPVDTAPEPVYTAVLSSVEARNTSSDLRGVCARAVLGGVELDLRDAVVAGDITVSATAVLGGVTIWAPRNVRIALRKTDILGGSNCVAPGLSPDANAPLVTFDCTAALGGIEIK